MKNIHENIFYIFNLDIGLRHFASSKTIPISIFIILFLSHWIVF